MIHLRIAGILGVWNIDCRVNDGYVVAPAGVEFGQEFFPDYVGKGIQVVIKVSVLIHVVDIRPEVPLGA